MKNWINFIAIVNWIVRKKRRVQQEGDRCACLVVDDIFIMSSHVLPKCDSFLKGPLLVTSSITQLKHACIFHHQHLSSTRKRFSNLCCFLLPSHSSHAGMKIRPGVFHYSGVVFLNYAKVFNGTFLSGDGSRTKRNLNHKNNKSKPLAAGAESGFSFCETVDDEGFSCEVLSLKFNSKLSRKYLAKFIAEIGLHMLIAGRLIISIDWVCEVLMRLEAMSGLLNLCVTILLKAKLFIFLIKVSSNVPRTFHV